MIRLVKYMASWIRRPGVPFVAQTSDMECGPACLAMLLRYRGVDVDLADIAAVCNVGRHGVSARDLAQAAEYFGYRLRAYSGDMTDLAALKGPVIIHWRFDHWMVLVRFNGKEGVALDPSLGRRRVDYDMMDRSFTGVLLQLSEGPNPQKRKHRKIEWSFWKRSLQDAKLKPALFAILLSTLIMQTFSVGSAYGLKSLIDTVIPFRVSALLTTIATFLLILALNRAILNYLRGALLAAVRVRLDSVLLPRFISHLIRLPISFFSFRITGDLMARVENYTLVRQLVTDGAVSAFIDGIFIVIYFVAIVLLDKVIMLWVLGLIALNVIVVQFRYMSEKDLIALTLEAEGEQRQVLMELLKGVKYVKAAGCESQAIDNWKTKLFKELNAATLRSYSSVLWEAVSEAIFLIGPLGAILISAQAVMTHAATIGALLSGLVLTSSLFTPLAGIMRNAQQMQFVRAYMRRLDAIIQVVPEKEEGLPCAMDGDIELKAVAFSYPGEPQPALQNISCVFHAGKLTVVLGATGSGKSTLATLLLRLNKPEEGTIEIDGRDIAEFNVRSLRQNIGTVLQEETVYGGTVRSNICLGRYDATLDEIVQAASLAGIHEEILSMPAGYETRIGEDGRNLSGGQRQRIAIARAILTKPKLLVLDEATCHLDAATEEYVLNSLISLGITTIFISHRLSAITKAHQLIVLDKGRIVEYGNHHELFKRRGKYWEITQLASQQTAFSI